MVPDTDFLLELNPTQKQSSMLGVNLWVTETTNNFTGTTPKSAPHINEADTKPRGAY